MFAVIGNFYKNNNLGYPQGATKSLNWYEGLCYWNLVAYRLCSMRCPVLLVHTQQQAWVLPAYPFPSPLLAGKWRFPGMASPWLRMCSLHSQLGKASLASQEGRLSSFSWATNVLFIVSGGTFLGLPYAHHDAKSLLRPIMVLFVKNREYLCTCICSSTYLYLMCLSV